MADYADEVYDRPAPVEGDSRHQTRVQRIQNETIDFAGDNRPESPTDAVMNYQRASVEQPSAVNTSSLAEPLNGDAPAPARQNLLDISDTSDGASEEHHAASQSLLALASSEERSGSDSRQALSLPTVPVTTGPASTVPLTNDPASPHYQPQLHGLDAVLINSAVPARFDTIRDLALSVDFLLPQVCRYMGDCTLHLDGSPPNNRKAVSHIFGRNKSCTRKIPDWLWLNFCRKHYQRGRYRNPHEYAIRQSRMVEAQVLRIQGWSNRNQLLGKPEDGILVDWALVVRRREQQRLEEEERRKASRGRRDPGAEDELGEGEEGDDDDQSPHNTTGGQVPHWLLAEVGTGHSTASIQRTIARIASELDRNVYVHFPDIEILPTIEGENAKPKYTKKPKQEAKKGDTKRAPAKQNARRQSDLDEEDDDDHPINHNKQQRRSHPDSLPGANEPARFAPRGHGLTVPEIRPMQFGFGAQGGPLPDPRTSFYHDGGYPAYQAKRLHQRAATEHWSSSPFPADASANGYNSYCPQPSNVLENTGGYNVPWNRPFMRAAENNGDFGTSQMNMNPAYAGGYGRQQQQHSEAAYQTTPYYASSSTAAPPPASAAKHMRSRNRSTPIMPGPRSTGFSMDAPQQGFNYEAASFYGQAAVPRPQAYPSATRAADFNGQISTPRPQQYQNAQHSTDFSAQPSNPNGPTGYEGYDGYPPRR
ncbi:hypothetical protein VTI74DRAFT_11113 [Chaetomium olivicolor]